MIRSLGLGRRILARRAPEGPLRDYYEAPYPELKADCRDVEFVALDLETTGLDPRQHEIVSIGWVLVRDLKVDMAEHGHILVKPKSGLTADSAVIHHIFDDHLETAEPIDRALAHILPILAGRALLAHHARVEQGFLGAACKAVYKTPLDIMVADTMALERRRMAAQNQAVKQGDLRLDAVRQRYNLPRYRAHNALLDAVACAELFLALVQHRAAGRRVRLGEVAA
ncbi:MAG: hypothetical protein KDE22_15895 [Rhodobacterales bacterium]|nr:hypothetical protein [Rhodobacterales bacterium]